MNTESKIEELEKEMEQLKQSIVQMAMLVQDVLVLMGKSNTYFHQEIAKLNQNAANRFWQEQKDEKFGRFMKSALG